MAFPSRYVGEISVVPQQNQRNGCGYKQIKVFSSLSEHSSTSVQPTLKAYCNLEEASKCCNTMQGNIYEQSSRRIRIFKSELKDVLQLCMLC